MPIYEKSTTQLLVTHYNTLAKLKPADFAAHYSAKCKEQVKDLPPRLRGGQFKKRFKRLF